MNTIMLRIKQDFAGLVNEILDQFPVSVWTSETSTFLDPEIGGGQIVREIVHRLRAAGHTDENINNRVFGLTTKLGVELVKKHHKLPGTYIVQDFLTWETNMEFDVIVGNPPFQNENIKDTEAKRKVGNKLWYQFIFAADGLVKKDGYVAMVSPNQWLSGGVQMRKGGLGVLKDIFAKKQLLVATVNGVTQKYFKGIGISIGWWVYQNCPVTNTTTLNLGPTTCQVDFKDLQFLTPDATEESISIVSKTLLSTNPKFDTYYFNSYCKPGDHDETIEATAINQFPHWIMGSDVSNNLVVRYFPRVLNTRVAYEKIVFPMSTRYWQPFLADATTSVASLGQALKVETGTTQAGFKSVFYSKLFTYLCFNLQIAQNGFMKTVLVKALPKLDMTRTWTDEELYAHFDLTPEEIEYIEANVT